MLALTSAVDITDPGAELDHPDTVTWHNCAAYTDVDGAESNRQPMRSAMHWPGTHQSQVPLLI